MLRDFMNHINIKQVLAPVAALTNADTAFVGAIIDNQGNRSCTYSINIGTNTDANATFTVLLEHGDDASLSDAAAVPDTQLVGTEALASYTFTHDNAQRKLGYIGTKRYTRLTITPSGNNSGDAFVSATAILEPELLPASNPPA